MVIPVHFILCSLYSDTGINLLHSSYDVSSGIFSERAQFGFVETDTACRNEEVLSSYFDKIHFDIF